jgi:hypothetical protein
MDQLKNGQTFGQLLQNIAKMALDPGEKKYFATFQYGNVEKIRKCISQNTGVHPGVNSRISLARGKLERDALGPKLVYFSK